MRIPIFVFLSLEFFSLAFATLSFDAPSGPHPVAVLPVHLLVDNSRRDLFAPSSPRRLLLSIYYPTANSSSSSSSSAEPQQYIPRSLTTAITAQYAITYNLTSRITLPFPSSASTAHNLPLRPILFSPGAATSRLIYSTLLSDLASHGYTVVSIDHPYDGVAVEFPPTRGGCSGVETVYPALDFTIEMLLQQRIADVDYVLRQLHKLPILHHHKITNSTRVGVMGHSLGEATAAWIVADSQSQGYGYEIVGGINLDGTIFSPAAADQQIEGLAKPFLLMGVNNHSSIEEDPSWNESLGDKVSTVVLREGAHMSYSDLAEVVEMTDGRGGPAVESVIKELTRGTLDGRRGREVVGKVVTGFWDWTLGNGTEAGFKAAVDGVSEEIGWVE